MLALHLIDADLYAAVLLVGLVVAVVCLVLEQFRNPLLWAVVAVFFVLAWDAAVIAGWG